MIEHDGRHGNGGQHAEHRQALHDLAIRLGLEDALRTKEAAKLREREVALARAAKPAEGAAPDLQIWAVKAHCQNAFVYCHSFRFLATVKGEPMNCYRLEDVREPVLRDGVLGAVRLHDRYFSAAMQLEAMPIRRPAWFDAIVPPVTETDDERQSFLL